PAGPQRSHCGTQHHGADNPLDDTVADTEIVLDELHRSGNDADVQAEHQPGQGCHETNEYGGPSCVLPPGVARCGHGMVSMNDGFQVKDVFAGMPAKHGSVTPRWPVQALKTCPDTK